MAVALWSRNAAFLAKQFLFDNLGKNVADERVAFLNARSLIRRHADAFLNNRPEFAAGSACEANRKNTNFVGRCDSVKHIWRIPAGRDSDGDVTRPSQGFHLARKNLFEPMIISNRGHRREALGERYRRKGGAIESETAHQFRGNMLSIIGTAAVAEEENFVAFAVRANQRFRD